MLTEEPCKAAYLNLRKADTAVGLSCGQRCPWSPLTRSQRHPCPHDNKKCLQTSTKVPWAEITPAGNHCSKLMFVHSCLRSQNACQQLQQFSYPHNCCFHFLKFLSTLIFIKVCQLDTREQKRLADSRKKSHCKHEHNFSPKPKERWIVSSSVTMISFSSSTSWSTEKIFK